MVCNKYEIDGFADGLFGSGGNGWFRCKGAEERENSSDTRYLRM